MAQVAIVITQDEARIWNQSLEKGALPHEITSPPAKESVGHLRQTKHQMGHAEEPIERGYFDVIADYVSQASEILLIGHGTGSSSAVHRFIKFTERDNPDFLKKIVGTLDLNLTALTNNQILAEARDWFDRFHRSSI